jgi:hypothetical protein
MKIGDVKVKPYKDSDGFWKIVSTIYEPPSKGKVGSGIIWATPYKTKKICVEAIKQHKSPRSKADRIHSLLTYVSNRIATAGNPKGSKDPCIMSRTEATELRNKINEARTLIEEVAQSL